MALTGGTRLGVYEVVELVDEGGPPPLAVVRARELWRDLAVAKEPRTR